MNQPKNVDEWVARPHKEDIQKVPEALRLADLMEVTADMLEIPYKPNSRNTDRKAAAELRRLHQHELSNELWHKKTEWVQNSYTTAELGIHRADVIKQRIDRLHSLNQELVDVLKYIEAQTHLGHIHDTASAALAKARGEA
jgi:CRISPR/Cas system-associated endoribonuclease Cas2